MVLSRKSDLIAWCQPTWLDGFMAAAAILMDTLDQGQWRRTGFNGLMLPVLEDSTLASRSETGVFSVKDLLMYSAVCGTGLDTVPLPGDISEERIEGLLMDIAALSLRLGKPLTARLMPVPGMKSGEKTSFDFAFFKNGGVMDFPGGEIGGLLKKADWIEINKRRIIYINHKAGLSSSFGQPLFKRFPLLK